MSILTSLWWSVSPVVGLGVGSLDGLGFGMLVLSTNLVQSVDTGNLPNNATSLIVVPLNEL